MKKKETEIKFSGVGLHSGKRAAVRVRLTNRPGIFFQRIDLPDAAPIPATWDQVSHTGLWSTTIGSTPNQVQTIEHFMAALFVCGIHSAVVEIDGPGRVRLARAARGLSKQFEKAGLCRPWDGPKIIVKKPVMAKRQELIRQLPILKRTALWLHNLFVGRKEDGFVRLLPIAPRSKQGLYVSVALDYPDKVIGKQSAEWMFDGTPESHKAFEQKFANARSFGRFWEWKYMKRHQMGLGANEDNIIVLMGRNKDWDELKNYVDNDAHLQKLLKNKGDATLTKLHSPDEFARHKLIDTVGDLATSGGMIIGKLESHKGSHALNNLVLRKLFSNPANYEIKN